MDTPTISTELRNLAADTAILALIPRAFNPLEIVAASSKTARELAGNLEPNRHNFLDAIPSYLKRLPQNTDLALDVISMDVAAELGIQSIADDRKKLIIAREKLASAENDFATVEASQGRRLATIQVIQKRIEKSKRDLEAWEIDFEKEIESAEQLILENWGKTPVVAPFQTISAMAILKKLAPRKISEIKAGIACDTKHLAELTQ